MELTEPWKAVEEAGGTPELVSIKDGEIQGVNHMDKADSFAVDTLVGDADPGDYDGLVLPGGVANPDFLRADDDAVAFARAFFEAGKPVAAICHWPWTFVEADVVRDRTLTSWPSLRTVDSGFVTSRKPDDLPAFCEKLVEEICEGRHDEQALQTAGAGNS